VLCCAAPSHFPEIRSLLRKTIMDNERHYLHTLFEPESIAVIGASETANSIGVTLVRNMLDSGYKGKLFFVNPKHETVFGQPVTRRWAPSRSAWTSR
jgi:predicted CoA-binding protein